MTSIIPGFMLTAIERKPSLPEMTKEQIAAIYRKAEQSGENANELVNKAQATIACDGAIALPWCGMILCIERDGYTHS